MKRKVIGIFISLLVLTMLSCQKGKHFISDSSVRKKVEKQFLLQKKFAKNRSEELFGVFGRKDINRTEKEALQFLYAYMSLSDLADYNGDFFLKNVRASLAARDTFSWGNQIPEDIFRHFVLPVRVNNENLDSSRWVFFPELKDRIRKLSMKEAVLEVNHWCHEKVTYRASDERTSSPLATVKNAYGRCGEESTFVVAALRAVGIPARQCYTPRWAHTDDNHAWVEVWVDGKWHYIGACEPEPVLDRAWFTSPAKRAMLVTTNVFGDYAGPEDILLKDTRYTRINVLPGYTTTKRVFVKVTGKNNVPVDSAIVEFQLYNYAEFYPLTKCYTDKNGICSLLTGLGDLLIWGSKGDQFGYEKIIVKKTDILFLPLSYTPGRVASEEFDLVPPPERNVENPVSDAMKNKNNERLAEEDRIRSNYEQTFIDSSKTWRLSRNLKINPDTLWDFLKRSRGNWREQIDFITSVPEEKKNLIYPLLNSISDKDLRDITSEILSDQVNFSFTYPPLSKDKSIIYSCILSPRVDVENICPYKSWFQQRFDKSFADDARRDPTVIINWIKSYILTDNTANYSRAPLTPIGVYELKVADKNSRNIFFVALCRSFGIPARLETATRIPQYFLNEKWGDVNFEKSVQKSTEHSKLVLKNSPENSRKPEYFTNFTIEKQENGFFRSLDFESELNSCTYPHTVELSPGSYMIVTGTRAGDGTVFSSLSLFKLEPGETKEFTLRFRKAGLDASVLGHVDDMKKFVKTICNSSELITDKGLIVSWLEPEKEPSRHFIADLLNKKQQFDKWKGSILLLFRNETEKNVFLGKNGKGISTNIKCLVASSGSVDFLVGLLHRKVEENLPVVIYINTQGEVCYLSEGYKIGSCDEIINLLK